MTIEHKNPPQAQRGPGATSWLAPIVEAALETPGQWVAMERADRSKNIQSAVLRLVGQHFAEVKVRGNEIYLRVHDDH